jgi:flagellar basal body-associated protein FliL
MMQARIRLANERMKKESWKILLLGGLVILYQTIFETEETLKVPYYTPIVLLTILVIMLIAWLIAFMWPIGSSERKPEPVTIQWTENLPPFSLRNMNRPHDIIMQNMMMSDLLNYWENLNMESYLSATDPRTEDAFRKVLNSKKHR